MSGLACGGPGKIWTAPQSVPIPLIISMPQVPNLVNASCAFLGKLSSQVFTAVIDKKFWKIEKGCD